MSIIKAFREESEVIKFDNLFTRDLEDEREFDLVFTAEQDDEDLKTIAGNKIMKEDGSERVFNIPDCVYVNEDGEVADKDDDAEKDENEEKVEDISSNDADKDGVDDDIEAAEEVKPAAAPSVVVNVDADDVNINAGDGGTSFEGSDEVKEDASVTVNAKVVNMTTNVDPGNKEDQEAPSTEPAAAPVPSEEPDACPTDDDNMEPVGDVEIDVEAEPTEEPESSEADVDECGDNCGSTPGTDDNGVPMGEGVEEIMTSSQLEDILNNGLDIAPAYENKTFINVPEDKSTEVVFSNSNDKEVREAAEPSIDPIDVKKEAAEPSIDPIDVVKEEIEAVKNDDNLESSKKIEGEFEDDLTPVTDGDIEKIFNNEPEDETKKDEGIDPVKPSDVPMNDGSAHEAAEPSIDPIDSITEEDFCCDPTEGDAPCADCQNKGQAVPGPKVDSSDHDPYGKDPIEDKEDGMETIEDLDIDIIGVDESESMDPKEDSVERDAETSLEGIAPSITDGDLEKLYIDKDVDPNRKNTAGIEEAAEPSIDPIDKVSEAAEPSIDPIDKVSEAAEPSIDPIETLTEEDMDVDDDSSEDDSEDKEEPSNEAAEPSINTIDKVTEAEIEAVKNDDNLETAKKIEGEFEDDLAPITDGDIEKIFNAEPEDETKKDEGIDPVKPSDVPMNDGSAHEAAEPSIDPIDLITEEEIEILDSDEIDNDNNCDISPVGPKKVVPDEVNAPEEDMKYDKTVAMGEADFQDQVNSLDNGDSFSDTMNTGLNISPEEVAPGSVEELIDDEAIAFIEGE